MRNNRTKATFKSVKDALQKRYGAKPADRLKRFEAMQCTGDDDEVQFIYSAEQ